MYYILKKLKVRVKKNKTLKEYWKNGKKKYWKSQGILLVRKSGNDDLSFVNLDVKKKTLMAGIYKFMSNFVRYVMLCEIES